MSDINSHGDGAIDRAIDRAVQRLVQAEPPAGLRRRVLARIEAPAPPLFPRLALAAGALAMMVLAVVLLRPSGSRVPLAPETAPVQAALPRPEPTAITPPPPVAAAEPPARPSPSRAASITREKIPIPRISNVFGARTARAGAAAAPVEDVVFSVEDARPEPSGLLSPVTPIAVPQITIEPLQIERLRLDLPTTRK